MNFSCPSCRAKYFVADEMVIGRTLKMKCRKCPAEIPIQGRPTSVAPRLKLDDSTPPSARTGASSISSDRLRLSLPYRRVDPLRPPPTGPSLPPQAGEDQPLSYRVAIAGKSEGPFGLEEIRTRMERGDVTPQSFVWRAGMARWRRLCEVSELGILAESVPPPSSTPPLSVRPEALMDVEASASEEEKAERVRRIEEELGFGDFSRQGLPSVGPAQPGRAQMDGAQTSGSRSEAPVVVPTGSRSGRRVAATAALLGSLGLGFLLGNWLSFEPRQSVVREVIEVPVERLAENVPPPNLAVSDPGMGSPGEMSNAPASSRSMVDRGVTGRVASAGMKAGDTAPAAGKVSSGLPGLGELTDRGGPAGSAPLGQTEAGTRSTQLSAAQIKRAIANYQGGVKRGCWQPALEGRGTMAPSTARVSVDVRVARDGTVSGVSSSGDPNGYPGLATCIEGKVRAFRFPSSAGETRVTIPFVFAAQ